ESLSMTRELETKRTGLGENQFCSDPPCRPDRLAQPPHAPGHLRRRGAAVAEDEALARIFTEVAARERHRPEVAARGLGGDPPVARRARAARAGLERRHQVQAGLAVERFELGAEVLAKGGDQGVPPLAVEQAHAPQVAAEVALG